METLTMRIYLASNLNSLTLIIFIHNNNNNNNFTNSNLYEKPYHLHQQQPPNPKHHGLPSPLRPLRRRPTNQSPRTNHLPLLPRMQQHALPERRPHDQQTHVRLPHLPVQRRGHLQLRVSEQHVQYRWGDGRCDAGCGERSYGL